MLLEILEEYFEFFGFTLLTGIQISLFLIVLDISRNIIKTIFILLQKIKEILLPTSKLIVFPTVSIIVPAHNEESKIEKCIISLIETLYPKDKKEIIVVDDGSLDKTYYRALPYARQGKIKLFKRNTKSGSKSGAINYGLLVAKSELIVVVDADTKLESNSLIEIVKPFSDKDVMAVAGNVKIENRDKLISICQAYEYTMSMEIGKRIQSLFKTILIVPGAFGAFRMKYVKTVGQYDHDTITEDFDLTFKVLKRAKVLFAPNALAWTICPDTIKTWYRQRVRWSRGEIETLWKHRDLFFRKHYGFLGMAAAPDMVLMDMILLTVRFVYFLSIIFYVPLLLNLGNFFEYFLFYTSAFLMLFCSYMIFELLSVIIALIAVKEKKDLTYFMISPIIVLIYRPLYALVRFKGYMDFVLKRDPVWR
ncbi:MAG: glycosyltransferase family 2 protein [Candidatus Methanofastidiosa archaeon]|nr:glycosyltransferase family 2 protein [Candidatus Methanofastidiosa archaeon]